MKPLLSLVIVVMATLTAWNAHAVPVLYSASLDGSSESPANTSPGTGTALVAIDTTAHTLHVMIDFADLLDTTTAAHIHGPTAVPGTGTAGVITATPYFPGFPLGVTSGSYDRTFDTTLDASFNPAFVAAQGNVAAAEAALAASLAAGTSYLNIHTTLFPGGEIRGFLRHAAIPEPGSLMLLLIGGYGLLIGACRHRR